MPLRHSAEATLLPQPQRRKAAKRRGNGTSCTRLAALLAAIAAARLGRTQGMGAGLKENFPLLSGHLTRFNVQR